MNRRQFLKATGAVGALTAVPWWVPRFAGAAPPRMRAAQLTTLGRTIVQGTLFNEGSRGDYFRLRAAAGESHILRDDLGSRDRLQPPPHARRSLLNMAHFTDTHIIDAQSPARVEFFDRYADPGFGCENIPFSSAHRAQETLTLQVLEAMIRQVRAVRISPVTGAPIAFAICTGDNIDNQQFNELRWFIDTMDGGKLVSPNSGGPDYEGVQSVEWADPEYWHPDPGVDDKYKQQWGFIEYPGLLEASLDPFRATGLDIPWLQTHGNHDGLLQGNAPRNAVFEGFAVGNQKVRGAPAGMNPCDGFQTLIDNPGAFLTAPMSPVTADPDRRVSPRREYIEEMFNTTGRPAGHGFTEFNRDTGVAYWANDSHPGVRLIGLDTVNPGGVSDGSIGAAQMAWLEEQLIEVSSRYFTSSGEEVTTDNDDRLVILFSHHGLRSLTNRNIAPDPMEPAANDLPRFTAEQIEPLVHRFPNVIAWVNGHSHLNIVRPRRSPFRDGGFWDIGTAAHIDWSCQSRLIDILDNRDGTLSIFCTMVDHAAPIVPSGSDPVLRLASISRELAANDYQKGFGTGRGEPEDRNVELVIEAPFRIHPGRGRDRTHGTPVPAGVAV
jgi:metallophosphoesterase (TIGR03767 family)